MKLRLCQKCHKAIMDSSDVLILVQALCETGQYRCPFHKLECGRYFDAQGKILAVTPLSSCQNA